MQCSIPTPRSRFAALAACLALVGSGFAVGGGILADDPAVAATLAEGAAAMAKSLAVPSVELRGGAQPEGEGWRREEGVYAGFARDLALNARFGATSPLMDAWTKALWLPNLFRRLFAEGAFAQAFVPVFARTLSSVGGWRLARSGWASGPPDPMTR